jgi:peptide/nickel transport system substrate-binding protein
VQSVTKTIAAHWRLVAIVLALLLAGCSASTPAASTSPSASSEPKAGGTLTIGTSTDVLTLDMANYRSGQDWLVGSLIFDTLVTFGSDGQPKPALAASWKQVDPTTYEFTLRSGVKFQDGTSLNSAAVKSQLERAAQGNFGKSYYFMIDTITATDDTHLTVKLKEPYAPFLNNLAIVTAGIESPASVQKFGDAVGRNPSGTGPFKLTNWVAGESMTLERNPDYWGPKPKLDKIVIKFIADESTRMAALDAGEIDVVQNPPPNRAKDLMSSSTLQLINGPYAQTVWLGFNESNPILSKLPVRQAILRAVDPKPLVQDVTEGIARQAGGFIPPEVMKDTVTGPAVDAAKAKQLIADAGYPNGFSIDLWVTNGRYLRDKEMAQALQAPLKAIGVTANLKVMDYAAFSSGMGRHEAGLFILGWGSTTNPDTMLRANFYSKSAANWSAYSNPKIDQLLDGAVNQASYDAATKSWAQLDQALIDDAAGVPIYWSSALYAAKKSVRNFVQTPLGLFDLNNTTVQ